MITDTTATTVVAALTGIPAGGAFARPRIEQPCGGRKAAPAGVYGPSAPTLSMNDLISTLGNRSPGSPPS